MVEYLVVALLVFVPVAAICRQILHWRGMKQRNIIFWLSLALVLIIGFPLAAARFGLSGAAGLGVLVLLIGALVAMVPWKAARPEATDGFLPVENSDLELEPVGQEPPPVSAGSMAVANEPDVMATEAEKAPDQIMPDSKDLTATEKAETLKIDGSSVVEMTASATSHMTPLQGEEVDTDLSAELVWAGHPPGSSPEEEVEPGVKRVTDEQDCSDQREESVERPIPETVIERDEPPVAMGEAGDELYIEQGKLSEFEAEQATAATTVWEEGAEDGPVDENEVVDSVPPQEEPELEELTMEEPELDQVSWEADLVEAPIGGSEATESGEGVGDPLIPGVGYLAEGEKIVPAGEDDLARADLVEDELPALPREGWSGETAGQEIDIYLEVEKGFDAKSVSDHQEAIRYFGRVWLEAGYPELVYLVGMELAGLYRELGHYDEALQVLEKLVSDGRLGRDQMNKAARELTMLATTRRMLHDIGLPDLPAAQVPRLIRLKVLREVDGSA